MVTNQTRKLIKLITFNAIFLSIGILGIELYFGNWLQANPAKRLPDLARQTGKRYTFRTHGLTGEDVVVDFYRDHLGLRGRDQVNSGQQILVLGGSTAIEFTVPEKLTWAEQLEMRLNMKLPPNHQVDVVNAGINGQTLLGNQIAIDLWLKDIKEIRPKIVIIYYGFNDAIYSTRARNAHARDPDLKSKSIKEKLLINSAFAMLARELKGNYQSWATDNGHNFRYIPDHLPTKKELISSDTELEDKAIRKSIYHTKLMNLIQSLKLTWPTSKFIFVAQSSPNCFFESFRHFRSLKDPKICSDMLSIHRYTQSTIQKFQADGDEQLQFEPLFLKNPYDRFGASDDIHANSKGSRNIAKELAPMLLKYINP